MKTNLIKLTILAIAAIFITSCGTSPNMKTNIEQTLNDNPEILFNIIKKNPAKFMAVVQDAAKDAQKDMADDRKNQEDKKFAASFENPLKPVINKDEVIRGNKHAPLTIVEYSDFKCALCTRGYNTVDAIMKKYPGKVRFIYKHLPLNFHPQALISAKYFEAIALQSEKKAFEFHDKIFNDQSKLKKGESFLKKLAKGFKLDMNKLNTDLNSKKVLAKIDADIAEAKKFGIQGTPGFVVNGISVKGAYPIEHFEGIFIKLKAMGKLKL